MKKLDNNSSGANKELESPNLIIIAIEEHLIRPNLVVNSSLCTHNVHMVVKRLPEVPPTVIVQKQSLVKLQKILSSAWVPSMDS